ncbi:MAG: GTPase HflX [Clostridiales bacterium]|nr:GTPase HflX [Clostridiales bacterium]
MAQINNNFEKEEYKEGCERALLISVDTGDFDCDSSADELVGLAQSAGARVLGVMIQKRESPSASSYVGSGRLLEIKQFCLADEIDIIIADGELTPVQVRNIEDFSETRVVDRTTLILDIFAKRARSAEGKIQVELAQLRYSLPRLSGRGASLSRLGGGIGTRGPGETKLETDKRHIKRRIQFLNERLEKIEKRRAAMHKRRHKNGAQAAVIVGYTNVGKSTLLNRLTSAGVLAEDKLFATLDPTARKLVLPSGKEIMLIDTVGLIRRLPHNLIDAFRSTLEEALWADVILNVCDASSEECAEHIKVTDDLLLSLGCGGKPVINVMNKCDLAPQALNYELIGNNVRISAATGFGINTLLEAIERALPESRSRIKVLIPFSNGAAAAEIHNYGIVHSQTYDENGIIIDATVENSYIDKIKEYIL